MPAYLIQHPGRPRDDIAITGDDLTLAFTAGWAIFSDDDGPTLAIPAADGATIQRIDPEDTGNQTNDGPAPGR